MITVSSHCFDIVVVVDDSNDEFNFVQGMYVTYEPEKVISWELFFKNKSGLNCCVYGDFNTSTTTSLETFDISLY